jgi:Putative DNA-binding domain
MSPLAAAQRDFMAALFAAGEPADPRLALYRRNVAAKLGDALAESHPVVLRLVGTPFFDEAARRFALAHPPDCGDLHAFGGFAAFLEGYAPARDLGYLPDVARLEWAVHESYHAADAPPFDFAALARIAPAGLPRLRFRLHPSARLVRSAHPVLAIWEANQAGRDGTPQRLEGADHVLVVREGFVVCPRLVDEDDWTFLSALSRRATLEEACEALGDAAETYLAQALARHVAAGVICG